MVNGDERDRGRKGLRSVPPGTVWTMLATGVLVAAGCAVWYVPAVRKWVFLGLYDFLVWLE